MIVCDKCKSELSERESRKLCFVENIYAGSTTHTAYKEFVLCKKHFEDAKNVIRVWVLNKD